MPTVYISNCGHDERGRYSGGVAGDQTSTEWHVIPWYQFGQNVVLRHSSEKYRALLAQLAREAAANNCIGYDQGQRLTFYEQLKNAGWYPRKITKACESDCSAGVCALALAAAHIMDYGRITDVIQPSGYTGNMREMFQRAGFEVLADNKYTYTPNELVTGDILLNERMHTCIVVNGNSVTTIYQLDVDGIVGYKTVLMMQKQLDCAYKDGLISGQFIENKKYMPNVQSIDWTDTGSITIQRLQKLVGADVDGYAGYETIIALQKWLNTKMSEHLTLDGVLGYHTATILQKALNANLLNG